MIKHDYKPHGHNDFSISTYYSKQIRWLTHPFLLIGTAAGILLLTILLFSSKKDSLSSDTDSFESIELTINNQTTSQEVSQDTSYSAPISIPLEVKPQENTQNSIPELKSRANWKTEAVQKNDNLSNIFKRIKLSPQQLHKVVSLDDNTKMLKRLRPGEIISYQTDNDNNLLGLQYIINAQKTLYIEAQGDSFTSRIESKEIEYRSAYIGTTIDDSLFLSGKKAGMTDNQIMQLAGIFDWDIDFAFDIRKGDSFTMLYQEKFIDGEKIADGQIVATHFTNQGKVYSAVRYTDSKDNTSYYTPEGLSMRKAFLRAPVNFKYISSHFNPVRLHPVLKTIRPHRGIDYVAPVGTPIRAAGDGKVITSGYNKYNGKYVIIQHGNNIVTKYLHLSKRTVSRGKRVKQGDIIGKLGGTGMVTGPHLHYEFVVNGVHKNPKTVKLPKAEPIEKSELARFKAQTADSLKQLASYESVNKK